MDLIVIPIDSVIDILTNSSSEMFVSKKGMSEQAVREVLKKIMEGYSTMVGVEHGMDVFEDDINILSTREDTLQFLQDFACYLLPDYSSLEKVVIGNETISHEKWLSSERDPHQRVDWRKSEELTKKAVAKWLKEHPEVVEQFLRSAVVHSSGDNSVPYELFDIIDRQLGGTHYHLG